MQINVVLTEIDLKLLVLSELRKQTKLGENLKLEDIKIETKSNQNYKSEWESAGFRARVEKDFPIYT